MKRSDDDPFLVSLNKSDKCRTSQERAESFFMLIFDLLLSQQVPMLPAWEPLRSGSSFSTLSGPQSAFLAEARSGHSKVSAGVATRTHKNHSDASNRV